MNEAFAAQSLAVIGELGLDPAKVNPLAARLHWSPAGCDRAIRTATLLHGMRRHKQKYGPGDHVFGTGMGAAGLFEAL